MGAKEHLHKIATDAEEKLRDIRIAVAIGLDSTMEAPDSSNYTPQLSIANELYEHVHKAEKLANKLWKSLLNTKQIWG